MNENILNLVLNKRQGEIRINEAWMEKVIIELADGTELPLKMYLKQELITILEEALKEESNE